MSSSSSSRSSSSGWSKEQNKLFERAIAMYDEDTPNRWHKVARFVGGGKSPEDARRHYERLLEDVEKIESGDVPIPNYSSAGGNEQQRTQKNTSNSDKSPSKAAAHYMERKLSEDDLRETLEDLFH